MEKYTLIPAEFGTVIYDDEVLKRLMRRGYSSMRECLRLVDGMVELGLKVVPRPEEHKEPSSFPLEEMIESLRKISEQSLSGELFSNRLLVNRSFLVKKGNVDSFSDEVTRFIESYPQLKFLYSGPWAPYNFVHIKIGKDGLEVVKP